MILLIEKFVKFYFLRNGLIISEIFKQETQINKYNTVVCLNAISKKTWHSPKHQLRNILKQSIATGSIYRQRKK
jgi:hypothetical protein